MSSKYGVFFISISILLHWFEVGSAKNVSNSESARCKSFNSQDRLMILLSNHISEVPIAIITNCSVLNSYFFQR